MRLDAFPIAVFFHKLPYCLSIIAVVAAGEPVLRAEKWQVKGELIPEGLNRMIIAGTVTVFYKAELGPEDGGPQQDRRYCGGVVASHKGGEGERTAVSRIAQSLAVGVAAAIEIHGPFAAACKKGEQEKYPCPVFHDSRSYL